MEGDRAGGESARLLLSDQSPAPAPFPHPAAEGLSAAWKLGGPGLPACRPSAGTVWLRGVRATLQRAEAGPAQRAARVLPRPPPPPRASFQAHMR